MYFSVVGYIADGGNHKIRMVVNGIISTMCGTGVMGTNGGNNGPATSATIHYTWNVVVDTVGNVYFSDEQSHTIRKVANGIVTHYAGLYVV